MPQQHYPKTESLLQKLLPIAVNCHLIFCSKTCQFHIGCGMRDGVTVGKQWGPFLTRRLEQLSIYPGRLGDNWPNFRTAQGNHARHRKRVGKERIDKTTKGHKDEVVHETRWWSRNVRGDERKWTSGGR